MKGKTSSFATESGKSQTKDTFSKVSFEPPTTPVSGDSRYLTRLRVSRHPEEVSQSTITGVGVGESSGFVSDMISDKMSLEKPKLAFSGEERYLTRLWVSRKADELYESDPSQDGFELIAGNMDQHVQRIHDKMEAVLKKPTFREQKVIVQFWSPREVGQHRLLTTIGQPFGLGVINDEGLYSYRRDSEHKFYDVDKDHDAEDVSPAARVFRLGLPEWTSDVTNYLPKDFPQQECAIRCNLNGYLALPVFNLTTRSPVGVIELLTSSKHPSFAYEVQQFQRALKSQNLTCRQVSNSPVSDVINEGSRGNELDDIFDILKIACDCHRLPLAQAWAVSSLSTIAVHEQVLRMSCNSFDSRCLGKDCMSTCGLPYYVKDLGFWPFREACMEQHLNKFCGYVGMALLSGGTCFIEDVTKLSEDEYPLVHFARMHGLTSSFAIHLHSVESKGDYVLEFYFPSHMKDIKQVVLNLVQLLKQYLDQVASRFELGDKSFIEVVGPPMDPCVNIEPDIIDTFSDLPDECSSTSLSTTFTESGETNSRLELGRKRKRCSKKMVYVKATYGEATKGFWFSNSSGLSKLKNKVAKRFKLKSQMIRLKYLDEDNDLILFSSNDDLEFAKISSGNNDRINLTCESVPHRVD